jgi:acylglycerol lipase
MLINNEFIYVKTYKVDNPKATIIFSHGIAEHHLRYEELYQYLNNNGYNVLAYDLRGHGRSGGKRGYVKSTNLYVGDLTELILYAKKRYKTKVYLLGHSMGALIHNLYLVSSNELNIDGVIASGTAGDFTKSTTFLRYFPAELLWFVKVKTNFSDPNLYSDPTQISKFVKDDYLLDYFYLSLIDKTMIKGIRKIKKNAHLIDIPYFFIHGEEDKVVPPELSKYLHDHIRSDDKTRKLYPNMKHNILNDQNSEPIFEDIVDWLDKRI